MSVYGPNHDFTIEKYRIAIFTDQEDEFISVRSYLHSYPKHGPWEDGITNSISICSDMATYVDKDDNDVVVEINDINELKFKDGLLVMGELKDHKLERRRVLECLFFLTLFLNLLSCKNISTEDILPPEKVNKKRIKNGKLPLYSYKVLNVNPFGDKNQTSGGRLNEYHNRLHFQRGHFKRFSEDKPLFGMFSGRYWWQPHLRGKNKDGFVDKEYHIRETF